MTHRDYIEELAAMGQLEEAVKEFLRGARIVGGQIKLDALGISGRYNSYAARVQSGTEDTDDLERTKNGLRIALLGMIKRYEPPAGITFKGSDAAAEVDRGKDPVEKPGNGTITDSEKTKVFISYSHTNGDYARRMKEKLEEADIEVFIDEERLGAGGDIKEFIREMINKTDATVSLVSKKALSSGWVGLETVMSLAHQEFREGKLFIPCSIETDFFNDDFVIERMLYLNQQIEEIDAKIKLITEKLGAAAGSKHLNSKRALMRDLLNNFDNIIDRLNRSYTVHIGGDSFDHGASLVIKKLKGE